jgi:hypothetical protein
MLAKPATFNKMDAQGWEAEPLSHGTVIKEDETVLAESNA